MEKTLPLVLLLLAGCAAEQAKQPISWHQLCETKWQDDEDLQAMCKLHPRPVYALDQEGQ